MGIIDSTTNHFRCRDCGAAGSSRVVERGSVWSGGSWGSPSSCEDFNIHWEDSEFGEPVPVRYSCRRCGSENVEHSATT